MPDNNVAKLYDYLSYKQRDLMSVWCNEQRVGQAFCNVLPIYLRTIAIPHVWNVDSWGDPSWDDLWDDLTSAPIPTVVDIKADYLYVSQHAKPGLAFEVALENLGRTIDKIGTN